MTTHPQQSDSQQREELSRMLPGLVDRDLTNDRQRQLQEFVMNEINDRHTGRAPRRLPRARFALATTAVIAVAAITAVTIGVAQSPGGDPGTKETPAPSTFELAADHAADQSFDPPGSDQWIYVKTHFLPTGTMAKDKGEDPDEVRQEWMSADGKKMADIDPETDKLGTWEQYNEYPELSTLPTDPEKLLSVLRDGLKAEGCEGKVPEDKEAKCEAAREDDSEGESSDTQDEDEELFSRVTGIMSQHLLPPKIEAALWKAVALIPGVTEEETIEVDGKDVIAVGQIQEDWRLEQLLVDPETYAFVGIRGEAVKDHTANGYKGEPLKIKKGEIQFEIVRLDAAVVDDAGETS